MIIEWRALVFLINKRDRGRPLQLIAPLCWGFYDPLQECGGNPLTREQRRLAAIVAADVVAYSRLIGRDESGTVARLREHRTQRLEPTLARHGGRLVKLTGDGALAEFPSAVDALGAAIEFQQSMAEANRDQPEDMRIVFRIGLHLGDLIVEGDDLYGDGVNVAARLEGEALPGGIVISGDVHNAVAGRLKAAFDDLGSLALKNIERPVQAFGVKWEPGDWKVSKPLAAVPSERAIQQSVNVPLTLPDKPSIAVLPFQNMSGDPEQEYFVDGVVEDIITELSRFHELFVIARNSSFSYKGKSPDVRQVGEELGVRYVLEGSIRRAGSRIRVTGQLIDTVNGAHIWADKYDRVLDDVFALQEELTHSIVRTIAPFISEAEVTKARRRPGNLGAYEIAVRSYAKAWDAFAKSDPSLCEEGLAEARAALAIDPDSTIALCAVALGQIQHLVRGTAIDRDAAWRDGMNAATKAIEIDRTGSVGYAWKGVFCVLSSDPGMAEEALQRVRMGYELNPHNTASLIGLAFVATMTGHPQSAIEPLLHALRVSPRDPMRPHIHQQLAMASFHSRRYADGVRYAQQGLNETPTLPPLHAYLAASYVGLADIEKARQAFASARRVGPGWVERGLDGKLPSLHPAQLHHATTFFRIAAGLEDPSAAEPLR